MSIRTTSFTLGEYYHIYNRGNSKQIIFKDKVDYERFIGLLYSCNSTKPLKYNNIPHLQTLLDVELPSDRLVAIGAYCLMPNHFHILITPLVENGVSLFMQKVGTAYSMYFNKKHIRTGALFEGKFKSSHIHNDRYLKYTFSYIHLNPVKLIDPTWKEHGVKNKKEIFDYLRAFKYSSFQDFLGLVRKENKILNLLPFPKYFPDKQSFEKEITSWFSSRQDLAS